MSVFGLDAAAALLQNVLGVRNDPYVAFNYLVEIEGLIVGGFSEVSGLSVETEVFEYREGGVNEYLHKLPGPTRYPGNLVLKHGLTAIGSLWDWHQDVTQGIISRKNGSIYLLDTQRLPSIWWNFAQAYPVRWQGPELRAGTNAVAVETVELVHKGITKPTESSLLSGVRGVAGAVSAVASKF